MRKNSRVLSLLIWYLPVLFVQTISARVTVQSMHPWYEELQKASWTPPSWVFGTVWTILYILMAVAIWVIYCSEGTAKQKFIAYLLFFAQLISNGLWSFLFFKYHLLGSALIDLILLCILVAVIIVYFYRISKLAAFLFLPYFLWALYALSLNVAICWLN